MTITSSAAAAIGRRKVFLINFLLVSVGFQQPLLVLSTDVSTSGHAAHTIPSLSSQDSSVGAIETMLSDSSQSTNLIGMCSRNDKIAAECLECTTDKGLFTDCCMTADAYVACTQSEKNNGDPIMTSLRSGPRFLFGKREGETDALQESEETEEQIEAGSSDGDDQYYDTSSVEEFTKRKSPFLGKRRSPFLGKRKSPFLGKRKSPFLGKRKSPFLGKRRSPFLGKRRSPFLGKREDQLSGEEFQSNTDGFDIAEKRGRSPFLGKRRSPFLGKRRSPFLGKRSAFEQLEISDQQPDYTNA